MTLIPLSEITDKLRGQVGGKAWALARMTRAGLTVPAAAVVPAEQYRRYVEQTELSQRINLELSRKRFEDMRWEEMWDAALRIRNMFASTPLPSAMREKLLAAIEERFGDAATVVRSSALAEDAAGTSFAGLHESYVNVRGPESIAEHVRIVWASLWSDAALLYRQELGLDPEESAMAVVIQRIVIGERSGVAFSRSPEEPTQGMIEAVWGLNQGLVDGTVEPDRWEIDRDTREVISHTPVEREEAVMASASGVQLQPLPHERRSSPPLAPDEVPTVHGMSRQAEEIFGSPQDTEWTFADETLHTLQSRPITTGRSGDDDGSPYSRSWYLSLRRSFDNLQALRERIEGEEIPAMIGDAEELAAIDLARMSDGDLAEEVERRAEILDQWHEVYWEDFIPFAHGARLFGQVYNDTVHPEDAYEFIDLLASQPMVSMERNRLLEQMAALVRERGLADALEAGKEPPDELRSMLEDYAERFSDPAAPARDPARILDLVVQMARRDQSGRGGPDEEALEERFLAQFEGEKRERAEELLDLGRASYRLRDDDNIYLGRVEAEVTRAVEEARRRIDRDLPADLSPGDAAHALRDPQFVPEPRAEADASEGEALPAMRAQERQLVGQPAGAGLARGRARVIREDDDLYDFEAGEILVIDSLDPTMTFVVPLAEGIVERRGGMLIHGAIIAREYGIACVTGVPEAAELIRTGDEITVDGYLGIVTISKPRE
ncbi:MAG: PEP/pyruvate-binding domain-containing protein [Armatimonadota bacterium]